MKKTPWVCSSAYKRFVDKFEKTVPHLQMPKRRKKKDRDRVIEKDRERNVISKTFDGKGNAIGVPSPVTVEAMTEFLLRSARECDALNRGSAPNGTNAASSDELILAEVPTSTVSRPSYAFLLLSIIIYCLPIYQLPSFSCYSTLRLIQIPLLYIRT